ncbi:haloacid dehalogenase [Spirochaetia bacterium]|nr:haloacid dehalogenase [Spirochaetia bacterium]GHU29436.1 haloacid dehalogenase [Spirochaetia bacterium]
MKAIADMSSDEAAGIRFVLMDIDDTITRNGKLQPESYMALWKLKGAGLKVIPITGRPAGWCDLIAREWPVDGVVGENGAFVFWEEHGKRRELVHPNAVRNDHPVLNRIRADAAKEVPEIRIATDQFARLFDLALDFAEEEPFLPLSDAQRIRDIALRAGAQAKISSIHVNVWMGAYDKCTMTEYFLHEHFGWDPVNEDRAVFFVGDSPNDEPMFSRFPLTAAVANIRRYENYLHHYPALVSVRECGEGFAEIVDTILQKRI